MLESNLEELRKKIIYQTTPEYMEEVGEKVRNGILERIPRYYEGRALGLLERVMRYYGGRFYTNFRLGYAGFNPEFYLSYYFYNSEYDVLELKDEQLEEVYLLTQQDIEYIVGGLVEVVEFYLKYEAK